MTNNKALFSWSGGKDSAFALGEILEKKEYEIAFLLTSMGQTTRRVSMHGVRENLIIQQADAIGLTLRFIELPDNPDMETYESVLFEAMNEAKKQSIAYSIFGDIFLEDLKIYREKQLQKLDFKAVFPLWKKDTHSLIQEFIDKGYRSIITAVDAKKLSKDFAGQVIDKYLIRQLPKDVDPCGENGEFHSFVFDAPYFKNPIDFDKGEIVYKEYEVEDQNISNGFWFCDLLPKIQE